ncbi:MAG: dihydrodipicolinate synthase family protein, partial [Bacteroidales bacterium]|nr:dihydrodipicolinate synthase family protein [Bacteroidales bacterium]
EDEVKRVVQIIVEEANGKTPVMPDIVGMRLDKSLDRVKMYADLGVDYIVSYTPYLILPKPEGLIDYYEKLADASPVPVILHSAKSRTGVELTPEMTATLARHPNIVATKDGNKQLDHLAKIVYLTRNEDFDVFTGKDTTAYPTVAFGGSGSFTVAGNAIPEVMKNMIELAIAGENEKARQIYLDYYPLFEAFRFETNPMAAKMALEIMGIINGTLRPPLTPLSEGKTEILKALLEEKGML